MGGNVSFFQTWCMGSGCVCLCVRFSVCCLRVHFSLLFLCVCVCVSQFVGLTVCVCVHMGACVRTCVRPSMRSNMRAKHELCSAFIVFVRIEGIGLNGPAAENPVRLDPGATDPWMTNCL